MAGFAVGAAIGFALCLGLAGGALLAWDAGYEGRVLPGVAVGGVDLSGLDQDGASAALNAAFTGYSEGRVVVRTTAGDVSVPYASVSRRPDVAAMVDEAMRTGRSGTVAERALEEIRLALNGRSLEPRVILDPTALTTQIAVALAPFDRPPVDSRIFMSSGSPQTIPARAGRSFSGTEAAAGALEVLRRTDAPSEIVVDAQETEIPPAYRDSQALVAKAAAERMVRDVVVTAGKQRWTIKAATVRGWIRFEPRVDGTPWPDGGHGGHRTGARQGIEGGARRAGLGLLPQDRSWAHRRCRAGQGRPAAGFAGHRGGHRRCPRRTCARRRTRTGDGPDDPARTQGVDRRSAPEGPADGQARVVEDVVPGQRAQLLRGEHLAAGEDHRRNGAVPGQRFEWWSALGPVTPARGFGPGGFIAGDHTEPTGALGGGMCSSSTTLFNAALRAGLDMGARANHKYYISRYPLGLDATVSKTRRGSQTVSFTNDMKHPIVIRTFRYRASGKGWVRYEIWGIPDGRTVSLSKPAVATSARRSPTRSTFRRSSAVSRLQVEYPANGMDVSVTRVVRRNGAVIHSETYRTHYVLWNGLVQIGS